MYEKAIWCFFFLNFFPLQICQLVRKGRTEYGCTVLLILLCGNGNKKNKTLCRYITCIIYILYSIEGKIKDVFLYYLFVLYEGTLRISHSNWRTFRKVYLLSRQNSNSIKLPVIGKVVEYRIQLKVPFFYARFSSLGICGFCCERPLGLSKFLPDDNRRRDGEIFCCVRTHLQSSSTHIFR